MPLAVIGAGAWGTALAATAVRAGCRVRLWGREPATVAAINTARRNPDYLPDLSLPEGLHATTDAAEALAGAAAVLLVTPAQHIRAVTTALAPHWPAGAPALIAAKGVELGTGALMTEVVAETLPHVAPAVLSGPTFAAEVAAGQPTAVTLAMTDRDTGLRLVHALGTRSFRPYYADDLPGAQVGGAVKNVIAIACGIVEGRALGHNARAALITRGLAEITRLGRALGARPETLMGLSGLGDLTLTCTGALSRNLSLGMALGRGETLEDVLAARRSVAEGLYTAHAVGILARRHQVDMPLCQAVDAVLNHQACIDETIHRLLDRPFRAETDTRE